MKDKINIGVVGVGHLGQTHARLFRQIESANLVGVYDIVSERSKSISEELGVKAFDTLERMLEEVDAASIVVPTSSHHEVAIKLIKFGKHCFIEKPLTSSVEEGAEICKMAKEEKVKVQVGHIERFNAAVLALSGLKLEPMFVESHRLAQFKPRALDVAVVLDLMVHDIDLILNFVKSPVVSIDASGVGVISETIDIANARLKFANGAVANLTSSRISQRQMRKMRLFQRDAYISLDFADGVAEVYRAIPIGTVNADVSLPVGLNLGTIGVGDSVRTIIYEQPDAPQINSLKMELELFVKSIIENIPTAVTPEEGLEVLKVADTIVKQIEDSNRKLKF